MTRRNTHKNDESINLNGDYDLLVLGSGATGNPSKSTRTLRATTASSQAMKKTHIRYANTHLASAKGAHFLLFDLH